MPLFQLSDKVKKEIVRYVLSFFLAWLVSALVSDFPYFKHLFIQSLHIDALFTKASVYLTEQLLNILGYKTVSYQNHLKILGTAGIIFAYGCLGFRELSFFIVFILTQKGPAIHKLWYIPSGIILLNTLNIFRATIIAIGQYHNPLKTQLIHDIVSPVLMYPAILFLWLFWLNTYVKNEPSRKKHTDSSIKKPL